MLNRLLPLPPPKLFMENVLSGDLRNCLFVFDFDGTLAEFSADPADARMSQKTQEALARLNQETQVLILSGRQLSELKLHFDDSLFLLAGEHGAESNFFERKLDEPAELEFLRDYIESMVATIPGSSFEAKKFSWVCHFRNCDPPVDRAEQLRWKKEIDNRIVGKKLVARHLNEAIEISHIACSKLQVIAECMRCAVTLPYIIFFGDDETEEEVFKAYAATPYFISVAVGDRIQVADYRIESPQELSEWLTDLMKIS